MQMMTIDSDSRETMIRHFTRVSPIYVWGSLLWLGSILWSSCLGERSSINYKYLDNNLYTIPALPRTNSVDTLSERAEEFERRFPPPPLFPPPPPSIKGDTNALLRQAIYNNLHDKLKRARKRRKGDGKEEGADSSGSITDFPCDKFLQQESSGAYTNKPDEPNKPVGPKVIKGPPGSSGLPGLPGPKGDRGRRGRKGHEGPTGPPGPTGIVGPPGPPGTAGRPGQHGRDGAKGDRGEAGADGFRGRSGPSGPRGPVGMPGTRGKDGIPGLVIFPDDVAMKGVELEGLLAYRQDSKQLYFRDHETWRVIRTSQCGDGIVDPDTGEECDDGDRKSRDCVSCQRRRGPRCGNGVREYNEECDGRDFAGKTCNSWRPSMKGTLYCTSSCVISYHRCRFDLR